MADVLSQSEIDNLLKALSSGEVDPNEMKETSEKSVKEYDFKRPAKFSKEHLRTLEIIFEHFGRLLSTNLPVYLRKNVQVSVVNSEALTFSEFTNSLSNPVILGVINFLPLNGSVMMELASNLGFAMIDRMLGGQGEPLEKSREFSEIELSIVEKIMAVCVRLLREPWKNVIDLNPVLERVETNPQFAQIIAPTEMISIVTLNMKIGDVEGLMNVCLPFFTLESIMDKLNTKFWFSTMQSASDEDFHDYLEDMINHVDIPIKAVLGTSTISVSDFVNLQLGDIIKLDSKVAQELNIYVGDIRKFTALPGAMKAAYAVRITSIVREEE
ncbi:MAG: flagellar motor switch protein FliM [Lachnospiraceae bacterium]|nr:flagellar motor switch protein FliM [Lachnospiraceae bacterium]